MAGVIFYFTGTGNSLAAARKLAAKLGDTKVVAIAGLMDEDTVDLPYERIGFAFPVYYATVPLIVRRFIKKLKFESSTYLYAVVTFGGMPGLAFEHLSRFIAEGGGKLSAGLPLRMPGNYILKYGAMPKMIQQKFFKKADEKIEKFAETVKNEKFQSVPKSNFLFKLLEKKDEKIIADFGKQAVNFHATERCNGCGTCARVCPVRNISISQEKRPQWGDKCERCMACIQWCPRRAIEYAGKTQKRKRYRNPEIMPADMTKQIMDE